VTLLKETEEGGSIATHCNTLQHTASEAHCKTGEWKRVAVVSLEEVTLTQKEKRV